MDTSSFLRVVGWGPWSLPGERRRLAEAANIARLTVGAAADLTGDETEPQDGTPLSEPDRRSAEPISGEGGSFRIGEKITFRLAGNATDCEVGFVAGPILAMTTIDVWVNPENTDMDMDRYFGGSISSKIRYWGAEHDPNKKGIARVTSDVIADELLAKAADVRPVQPGTTFVTGAGGLFKRNNVRYIIHVASVQGEPGMGFRSVALDDLRKCVINALFEAESLARKDRKVRSILFPLLGTGEGRAKLTPTVEGLTDAAIEYLENNPGTLLKEIYFLAFNLSEQMALMSSFRNSSKVVVARLPGKAEELT
jgi:O-acetyl-ADP-ribose deacetylase (regulator of RNase III)